MQENRNDFIDNQLFIINFRSDYFIDNQTFILNFSID